MTALFNPFIDHILTKTDGDASPPPASSARALATPSSASPFKKLAQTGEGEMARNRLVISGLILTYFVFEVVWNSRTLTLPLFVIASFFMFSLVLSLHIIASPQANFHRRIIALGGDIGTLSIGLYIGAEVTAATFPIYLWIIFGNGFRFGLLFLTLSSLTATVCFALVVLTTGYWQSFYNLAFGLLLALIVLPLYARKLIRDLSDARKKAETASEMKSLFLASVSHELRTPLNAIIGLSDLMSATKLNEDQREMSSSINASGRSLCGLIDNFLDYSRLEAGAMPTNKEPFCVVALLTELNCIARAQARDKPLTIGLHVTPRTPTTLVGDRGKLAQILTNLIANAIKFTEQGSVSLSMDGFVRDGDTARVRFEVIDTGIGISHASQKHIFEQFMQADNRIVDQYGGTGLGLAIAQQLVELLGGEIGVVSAPGDGATFWCEFDLPVATAKKQSERQQTLQIAIYADTPHRSQAIAAATGYDRFEVLDTPADVSAWLSQHETQATGSLLIADTTKHDAKILGSRSNPSSNVKVIALCDTRDKGFPNPDFIATSFSQVRRHAMEFELKTMIAWLEHHRAIRQDTGALMTAQKNVAALSILVAEDNHANQMVVRKILNQAGHQTVMADDGEQALEALARQDFDVILLDLNMPRMNGFEALKFMHFALHDEDIPIIALTADASVDTNKKCLSAGFDACITKPYNPGTLLQTIQELTDRASPADNHDLPNPDTHKGSETESGANAGINSGGQRAPRNDPATTSHPETLEKTPHPIDVEQVATLANLGNAKFFNDLINEFDSEALEILSQLRIATDARDVEKIRLLAHALKSSAVNFGAVHVVQKCERLEYGDRQDVLNSAAQAVVDLRTDYEAVRSALVSAAIQSASLRSAAVGPHDVDADARPPVHH